MVYPENIAGKLSRLRHIDPPYGGTASAVAAKFNCGSFVRFSLAIDPETGVVADVNFASNGCGFMLAAADVLAENMIDQRLTDLHGLATPDLQEQIRAHLGEFSPDRTQCATVCIEALRAAFADFRTRQIEEFQGEKALICTCFGVSEETIESHIRKCRLETVDEVARACNAGSGCGSCRMLIQEIIDAYQGE